MDASPDGVKLTGIAAGGPIFMSMQALRLGGFAVDDRGRMRAAADREPGLSFSWRNRRFRAVLRHAEARGDVPGEEVGRLLLSAEAGRIPTTAFAAERRPAAFGIARQLRNAVPPGMRLELGPDHVLRLHGEAMLSVPATVEELLLSATRFALAAGPYFDLLEENAMGMAA
jgi:hypothetical protein